MPELRAPSSEGPHKLASLIDADLCDALAVAGRPSARRFKAVDDIEPPDVAVPCWCPSPADVENYQAWSRRRRRL